MKDNLYKLIFCFILYVLQINTALCQLDNKLQAEHTIKKEELLPVYRLDPYPSSGIVKFNAPSFICKPVILKAKGLDTFHFDYSYRYMFRVSQDINFLSAETILSDTLDWTIFNTHKKLKKGKWYWQYAYVKNGKAQWKDSIEFTINGNEIDFVSPSINSIIDKIGNEHPRILTNKEGIGNINLPNKYISKLHKHVDKHLKQKLPALIYANKQVMAQKKKKLSGKQYQLFITKRTRDNCKKYRDLSTEVVMLYLATGERKYLDEAVRRFRHFDKVYKRILEINQYNDFTEVAFLTVMADVFDIAYDFLSQDERADIIQRISKSQEHVYHKILHKPGHVLHDSHFWQIELRSFFVNSLLLINHTDEAKKWLNYACELYVVRAPTGGMSDGGWAPGNKYFGANAETLFVLPYLLTRISGFDYFSKPWYKSVSEYLAYTSPIAHISSNFGDGTDAKENMYPFVMALNRIKKDPYARYYKYQHKLYGGKLRSSKISKLDWFSYQPLNIKSNNIDANFTKAKSFNDVGTVVMHSDLYNPNNNLMLAFRASPYGVVGHSHAAQNAFNIQFAGEPLFFHTGYYTSWADSHSLQSYRHTRAHNSILVDGLGQNFHTSGYAWIARFYTDNDLSYALGDASRAYSGTICRDAIARQMKKHNVEATKEFGFGDPGLKTFRRHIFMLKGNVIVIYDVLEAETPVDWTICANSREKIESDFKNVWYCQSKKAKAQMQIFSNSQLVNSITDEFYSPAIDWQGKAKKLNNLKDCWHAKAKTDKSTKARFLSIIQVGDVKGDFKILKTSNKNIMKLCGWEISAELDINKSPSFLIKNTTTSISYGHKFLKLKGEKYKTKTKKSSVILKINKGMIVDKEIVDSLPASAIYY